MTHVVACSSGLLFFIEFNVPLYKHITIYLSVDGDLVASPLRLLEASTKNKLQTFFSMFLVDIGACFITYIARRGMNGL